MERRERPCSGYLLMHVKITLKESWFPGFILLYNWTGVFPQPILKQDRRKKLTYSYLNMIGLIFAGHSPPPLVQTYGGNSITPNIKSLQTNNPEQGQCLRGCGKMSAVCFHIFWECPNVSSYWVDVITGIRWTINLQLVFSFSVINLGNIPAGMHKQDRYLLQILLASSKKDTRKWLSTECPTILDWIEIVKEIHNMERLTFSLRYDTERGNR